MESASPSPFDPLSYDLMLNPPETSQVVGKLVSGEIKIMKLFSCDPSLFARVREEVMGLVMAGGAALDAGHPTFDYIAKWDPDWQPKPGTVIQLSLFNTRGDVKFFEEDHHWFPGRSLNPKLRAVPEFFAAYFKQSELQNCRIQGLTGGGELGLHRERIVGIPKREQHYKLRFHLPIVTNPGVKFLMDGQQFQMEAGSVYIFNQWCLHGVTNQSDQLRVHLYWDLYLNPFIANEIIAPAAIPVAEAA